MEAPRILSKSQILALESFGSPEARRDLLKTLQACKKMNRTKVRSEEQTQDLRRQIAEMQDRELTSIVRRQG